MSVHRRPHLNLRRSVLLLLSLAWLLFASGVIVASEGSTLENWDHPVAQHVSAHFEGGGPHLHGHGPLEHHSGYAEAITSPVQWRRAPRQAWDDFYLALGHGASPTALLRPPQHA